MYQSDKPNNEQDLQNQNQGNDEDSAADAFASIAFIVLAVAAATTYVLHQGFYHL